MRVVSLNCSNTEIVCALGCAGHLVGVDSDSDYPEEVVSELPRVGRDLDIEIDKVADLEPDLVLASITVPGHEKVVAGLEKAGLRYFAPETMSLEDTYDDIRKIADMLEVPERGDRVAAEMQKAIAPVSRPEPERPSILIQWWPKPVIVPGRLSWATDLLDIVGARNPIGEREVKSQPLSDEEVRDLAPDAIVISWCGVKPESYRPEEIYKKEIWQELDFVSERRVYCVPEAYLGRPGPRLVQGYRELRRIAEELG